MWKALLTSLFSSLVFPSWGALKEMPAGGRWEANLNDGWRFEIAANGKELVETNPPEAVMSLDEHAWQPVCLPHTPRLEQPEQAHDYFQGICWYRRHLIREDAWKGKKVTLEFEGAMQVADVWVNGRHVLTHEGGYLPFAVDVSDALATASDVLVAVRLDNTDQPSIPPGKPHGELDFSYFGGLYRDVKLVVTDPLHVTDAVSADSVAGGGVFVRTESASANAARVFAQADVRNEGQSATKGWVRFVASDPDGTEVAQALLELPGLPAGAEVSTHCMLAISQPKLWHPDHPWLYTLKTEVRHGAATVDSVATHFGIRRLAYDDRRGFVINGEPLTIRGANRHQDFPWLGNAGPDNAQFRDLKRLKDAGFNFLRLAHYPQSPAVMDACDKLGLMVSVCPPGWQWFPQSTQFQELARRNERQMVRWHRNHPCVIMWEASLNETYGHDDFYAGLARIAHEEYPGDQMFVCGDTYASREARRFEVPYAGWAEPYSRPAAPGFEGVRRSFAREYGDYEFGGEDSTTRVPRGAGETALLLQAWNFVWSHNRNASYAWLCGDCIWEGVDNFRGCSAANPISRCGVLDFLRLPKFSYYFFQSQRSPAAPMVFIANYWTPRASPAKVVVFSNCAEVELFLNGKSLGRRKPDSGPDGEYGVWHPEADPVYMASGKTVLDDEKVSSAEAGKPPDDPRRAMFDGGNCRNVEHPPFTFAPVDYAPGRLRAVGYMGGKVVAEGTRQTPGKPAQLKLEAALEGLPLAADGADAVFVRATICDAEGVPVPDATNVVSFAVAGEVDIVSPARARAEAGVASVLLQSRSLKPGHVVVRASAAGLKSARLVIKSTR